MKKGMIKVSVMYPNGNGSTFNMDYYSNKHVPMVAGLLGNYVKNAAIEKGLAGGDPDSNAPFAAMGHLYFDTIEDFENSFGPNAEEIMADLVNFTNVQPTIQISEVIV